MAFYTKVDALKISNTSYLAKRPRKMVKTRIRRLCYSDKHFVNSRPLKSTLFENTINRKRKEFENLEY